jgi:hypothetical protein
MTDARLRIREALAPALPLPCRSCGRDCEDAIMHSDYFALCRACLDAGITNVTLDADAEEQE